MWYRLVRSQKCKEIKLFSSKKHLINCQLIPDLKERMTHSGISLHSYGQCEVDGASESYLGKGEQDRHHVLVQAGRSNTGCKQKLYTISTEQKQEILTRQDTSEDYSKPWKHVGDAKDDTTRDDVEEITKGQDTHELVEIVLLPPEPDDQADVPNNAKNSNQHLK